VSLQPCLEGYSHSFEILALTVIREKSQMKMKDNLSFCEFDGLLSGRLAVHLMGVSVQAIYYNIAGTINGTIKSY
jgi:hypothetical protein